LPDGWPPEFAVAAEDRGAALVLASLRGVAPLDLLVVADRVRTASACLRAIVAGEVGSDGDRAFIAGAEPKALRGAVDAAGARFVAWGDPEYPGGLGDLADPPLGVFVRGRALEPPSRRPAVAMVGARRSTPYGREVAERIAAGLAAAGVVVVSGAALGIDAAAHRGALTTGWTVGVLGSGIDEPYPATNRVLIERIASEGTLLSEYAPGTPAEPFRFPARNRIVAALVRAVIVVEGAPGSGSMITVGHALDCGRDVLAVPGPVTAPLSAIPNDLIRGGAPLVRDAEDALEDLGLAGVASADGAGPDLSGAPAAVLAALGGVAEDLETIATRSGMPAQDVLTALLELELRGLARRVGGRFERTLLAGL
jgi:DNA processing protein